MNKRKIHITSIFLLTFLISLFTLSCKQETKNKILLPAITGKSGEIILVIKKSKWNSAIGDKFKSILERDHSYLPQSEQIFNLINIPHTSFSDLYKKHRNIIVTQVSKNVKKNIINVKKDVYASPQLFIVIKAKTNDDLIRLLEENAEDLERYIAEKENKRLLKTYKKFRNKVIQKQLKEKHKVYLCVPNTYTLDVDSTNFVWLSQELRRASKGIFIYHYNYTDTNTFTKNFLIKKRDEILKKYVKTDGGAHMTTEKEAFPIEFKSFMKNKKYFTKIRGLWKTEGSAEKMGGPFISLTSLNKAKTKVITVEAYIYHPNKKKLHYLRQLEAILSSFEALD